MKDTVQEEPQEWKEIQVSMGTKKPIQDNKPVIQREKVIICHLSPGLMNYFIENGRCGASSQLLNRYDKECMADPSIEHHSVVEIFKICTTCYFIRMDCRMTFHVKIKFYTVNISLHISTAISIDIQHHHEMLIYLDHRSVEEFTQN